METLEDSKEYLRANWQDGVACPCCKQFVKLYKRRLHKAMAVSLIKLYKLKDSHEKYYHINDFVGIGMGDFAKLKYWGFILEAKNDDDMKRTSGMWKITQDGIDFVEMKRMAPLYALVFNSSLYGFTGEPISIKNALGKKFNYEELMA